MSRTLLDSFDDVRRWVAKQVKPCEFGPATDTGRPADNIWTDYRGPEHMPQGVKLLLRAKGSKGGAHVLLSAPQTKALAVADGSALQARAQELEAREADLREREFALVERERRAAAEYELIKGKADERMRAAAKLIADWEDAARRREQEGIASMEAIRRADERANAAEEKQATAAGISYGVDRLIGAAQLWRVKKLDDVPTEVLEDFQQYLLEKAARRFLQQLPGAPRKLAMDFMRLSKGDKQAFLGAINEAMQQQGE